jgi:4-amino-4-deoxy-L-arabinose transferase-like glycosyltransferase
MYFLRSHVRWLLASVILAGAFLRFYGLSWGVPYHHFHIDEHFVFVGADLLRESMRKAAMNPKFFMYAPLPMYLVNVVRTAYEWISGPLTLSASADATTYMLLGRAISATLGTATIPLVFHIGRKVAGPVAGLLSAAFLAFAVLHFRDSHFFTVDISLVFFCMATLAASLAIAEHGRWPAYLLSGVGLGAALLCKYTAVFLVPVVGVAHLCAPNRPAGFLERRDWRAWAKWGLLGCVPVAAGVALFLALDPMVFLYYEKFRLDVQEQITGPLLGGLQPLWSAHFRDIRPMAFWFSNLLPWGLGPSLMLCGLLGVVWLLSRKHPMAVVAGAYPVLFFLVAGQTITPFMRYSLPLVPGLAVTAGVLCADLLAHQRWRRVGSVVTAGTVGLTMLWAVAYVNIYRSTDVRLEASRYLMDAVPQGAQILVEPSHNVPPTGRYLSATDFYADYVGWGPQMTRRDYYTMHTLDVYRHLYGPRLSPEQKAAYIAQRLARADYVLMDDTFMEFYDHLPEAENRAVKQYYRDLFEGRLGFRLVRSFIRRPALFGWQVNDDPAELTFTLFDHPEIYLFERIEPRTNTAD